MSIITRQEGKCLLVCKGAPENMLQVCSTMKTGKKTTELDEAKVNRLYEDLSRKGIRAIGLATKEVDEKA